MTAAEIATGSRRFNTALVARALGGELTHPLGYPPGAATPALTTNRRRGTSGRTVLTDDGAVAIEVPRDRAGTFEPPRSGKHERRLPGGQHSHGALHAACRTGDATFRTETSAVDVSPDLISTVTDATVAEGHGMAGAAARAALARGVLRCAPRQESR